MVKKGVDYYVVHRTLRIKLRPAFLFLKYMNPQHSTLLNNICQVLNPFPEQCDCDE